MAGRHADFAAALRAVGAPFERFAELVALALLFGAELVSLAVAVFPAVDARAALTALAAAAVEVGAAVAAEHL